MAVLLRQTVGSWTVPEFDKKACKDPEEQFSEENEFCH